MGGGLRLLSGGLSPFAARDSARSQSEGDAKEAARRAGSHPRMLAVDIDVSLVLRWPGFGCLHRRVSAALRYESRVRQGSGRDGTRTRGGREASFSTSITTDPDIAAIDFFLAIGPIARGVAACSQADRFATGLAASKGAGLPFSVEVLNEGIALTSCTEATYRAWREPPLEYSINPYDLTVYGSRSGGI
jgi:hypothetical protein